MESNTTTTTLEEVNTDVKIVKTERFDPLVMDQLLADTVRFSPKALGNLGRYKRGRKHGNEVEVVYHYGRGCEKDRLGRLYPHGGQGLQSFPFDMRNPLLEKHYWDCDMENCHYRILIKLGQEWGVVTTGIRKYVENRDEELAKVSSNRGIAKTAFIKVAYGGDIKLYNEHYNDDGIAPEGDVTLLKQIESEIKSFVAMCWSRYDQFRKIVQKKTNPKFSLFALILQTEERKCLEAMDAYMKTQNRRVEILIHDGGEILKLDGESEFPEELLRGAENYILEKTGYSHKLLIKPWQHNFTPKPESVLGEDVVTDDSFGAKKFAELMGDLLVMDGGVIWVFDKTTGIWGYDEKLLQRVVTRMDTKLHFRQASKEGIKLINFSGSVKKTRDLITKLPDVLDPKDGWFMERSGTDYGKLLFADGIYDFKTKTFTKGFDHTIVFSHACPRNFPARDEEKIRFVKYRTFEEPFTNPDFAEVFKHNLMRNTIGDFQRKKVTVGIGFTNSSKGTTIKLYKTAFGQWVGDFNGNSLLTRHLGGEPAREMEWLQHIADCRFAFGSEIRVDLDDKKSPAIDGNLLKAISGGGDILHTRKAYQQGERPVLPKCGIYLFANDAPKIAPPSEIGERLTMFHWAYSYVPDPKRPYERKSDNIKELYGLPEYGDALIHVMIDAYEDWRAKDFAEPVLPDSVRAARDQFINIVKVEDVIEDCYELTKNVFHTIPFEEIYERCKAAGVKETDNKVGRILTELGIGTSRKRVGGAPVVVRTGLRLKPEVSPFSVTDS